MRQDIKGRWVCFHWLHGSKLAGRVLYQPGATGDSWIISDNQTNGSLLHYIQNFDFMTVYPDPLEPTEE